MVTAVAGCSERLRSARASTPQAAGELDELVRLHQTRDFFAQRERPGTPSTDEPAGVTVLRAASAHAFNDLERSERLLDGVLSEPSEEEAPGDSLLYEARRIRAANLVRLFRYGEAADALEALMSDPPAFESPAVAEDHRKMLRLTQTLEGVPPQRVEARSEASALGLEVRETGLRISTAMVPGVRADVAVADRLRLGGIELRNVVFLVLPDEVLTFPGVAVRGVPGFPVVEALGEVRFRPDGAIEVPGEVPERAVRNLALHDLSLYVRVGHPGEHLVCALDRGTRETWFLGRSTGATGRRSGPRAGRMPSPPAVGA